MSHSSLKIYQGLSQKVTPWRLTLGIALTVALSSSMVLASKFLPPPNSTFDQAVIQAFDSQSIHLNPSQVHLIRENVKAALNSACQSVSSNSQVKFGAVEIADQLHLNPQMDTSVVNRITTALESLANTPEYCSTGTITTVDQPPTRYPVVENQSWETYFNQTIALNTDPQFISLVQAKQFSPVHISWEDIGRYEGSVWGNRISDVGIWVRKDETDLHSAQLALSVRRDENYRDKVLVVPASQIKVHLNQRGHTTEVTLPQRLQQLGLASKTKDKNVIVSNQFAVVPVPAHQMSTSMTAKRMGHSPRAAFNFSINPYGSTNFVITDVIEGSSNAIVGPGNHQLLYANINGQKAPFTASRAEDRQDLLQLERELKAQGMDVDVQRYYLIQIPLKSTGNRVQLSNMGTPPMPRYETYEAYPAPPMMSGTYAPAGAAADSAYPAKPIMKKSAGLGNVNQAEMARAKQEPGMTKVAIGHGDAEGRYNPGSGWQGQRAEEPIRVTVVYFVTPVGKVTQADMDAFAKAFEAWDNQAIWGGSFVLPDQVATQ